MNHNSWNKPKNALSVMPRRPPPQSPSEDSQGRGAVETLYATETASCDMATPDFAARAIVNRAPRKTDAVRLVNAPPVGKGEHRSGWPYVLQSLRPLMHPHGILIDDFVERTFLYDRCTDCYQEPWIGVFHHPFYIAPEIDPLGSLSEILKLRPVANSLLRMKAAVALSEDLARSLREVLGVPVYSAKHPTYTPDLKWTPQAYLCSEPRRLVQVGVHLRNTRLIHQIEPLNHFQRCRLDSSLWWLPGYERRVAAFWGRNRDRREYPDVAVLPRQNDEAYDRLLASSVICSEVFATSANNLVVECIVRNTPIVINRHPAVEEYLTREYPLYFEHPREIPSLLNTDRILQAHEHLLHMDKRCFDGDIFRERLANWLKESTND